MCLKEFLRKWHLKKSTPETYMDEEKNIFRTRPNIYCFLFYSYVL